MIHIILKNMCITDVNLRYITHIEHFSSAFRLFRPKYVYHFAIFIQYYTFQLSLKPEIMLVF